MTGLAVTRTVVIGEGGDAPLAVTVRELTVAEIRAWLADVQQAQGADLVDVLLLKDTTLQDLMRMSSLSMDQINQLTPSQLRAVLDTAREINADFFVLRGGIVEIGTQMLSPGLNGPSQA